MALLLAVDLETLCDRLELLLGRWGCNGAEDHLGNEPPPGGNVPFLCNRIVNEGVIVLQIDTKSEGLETGPNWSGQLLFRQRIYR